MGGPISRVLKEHGKLIGTARRDELMGMELELFLQRLMCSFQSGNYEGWAATLARAESHQSKGGKETNRIQIFKARKALFDGDLDLAHNLATEASVLAVRVGGNQKDYARHILHAVSKARVT